MENLEAILESNISDGLHFLRLRIEKAKQTLHYKEHNWYEGTYPFLSNFEFEGRIYDLGFYTDGKNVSAHIVFGNEPGQYMSGNSFWATSILYRKVAGMLLMVRILQPDELMRQFARYNNWEEFYNV